ncbi:MAG TPA: hypothetical protein ENG16_01560 [Archaeoglobus sp.]|nr:hypothetical protein [Archaeoglobus sp.]
MEEQVLLEKFESNGMWLNEHYDEIYRKYRNEFVAVKDRRIIAHNSSFEALLKELKAMRIDLREVLVEYISEKGYEIIM